MNNSGNKWPVNYKLFRSAVELNNQSEKLQYDFINI
jgi:hypothetical protein